MRPLNQLALVSACFATLALNGFALATTIAPGQGDAAAGTTTSGSAGSLDSSGATRIAPGSPIGTPYGDDVYNPTGPEADDSAPDSQWFSPNNNDPGSLSPDMRGADPREDNPYFGNPFGDDLGDGGGDTIPPVGDQLDRGRRGDLNRDRRIDVEDLVGLVLAWGVAPDGASADLNGDRRVDQQDVAELFALWD